MAEICFIRLNLLLVAVEARKYEGGDIWINPMKKEITANCIGLFITNSSDAVKRAWFFCRVCHENIVKVEDIKKCACKKLAKTRYEYHQNGQSQDTNQKKRPVGSSNSHEQVGEVNKPSKSKSVVVDDQESKSKMKYDSTGTFHWCSPRVMQDALITRLEAEKTVYAGHVVLAIFADDDSPILGLRNLVMPLRASNIPYNELRQVIILGNFTFLKKYS